MEKDEIIFNLNRKDIFLNKSLRIRQIFYFSNFDKK